MADSNPPLRVETGAGNESHHTPPPIAAAFLVKFDHRKGYILAWQRALDGIELEGAVELKSLPSGLHNVEEDLVYFVHGEYIGVSSYLNTPDSSARGSNMIAVGVLVPLKRGRMARAWGHASGLKRVAKKIMQDKEDTGALEQYWEEYKIRASSVPPEESTDDLFQSRSKQHGQGQANGYQKFRSMSAGSVFVPGSHSLGAHHPATKLMAMFDLFGPLIFPLYRFALLKKRILILGEAPVEMGCDMVYNLSILSTLPASLLRHLHPAKGNGSPGPTSDRASRPQPLFTVGITDIPLLSSSSASGWIANTTDDVLATKPECFDILVLLPANDAQKEGKAYPRIIVSTPEMATRYPRTGVKASQRDGMRYRVLRETLRKVPGSIVEQEAEVVEEGQNANSDPTRFDPPETAVADADDAASTISTTPSSTDTLTDRRDLIEPASWSQVAYTSLLWWASAGDRRAGLTEAEEAQREVEMSLIEGDDGSDDKTKEILLVGYMRRLTEVLVRGLSECIRLHDGPEERYRDDEGASVDGQDEDAEHDTFRTESRDDDDDDTRRLLLKQSTSNTADEEPITLTAEDISSLALDIWSSSDREFVTEFVRLYFSREVSFRGVGVECCGIRIL
jgi:hypothetical protein